MDSDKKRSRGRPPLYGPGKDQRLFGVHVSMSSNIWEAVRNYAEAAGEHSLSKATRTLLLERLTQLGWVPGQMKTNHVEAPH